MNQTIQVSGARHGCSAPDETPLLRGSYPRLVRAAQRRPARSPPARGNYRGTAARRTGHSSVLCHVAAITAKAAEAAAGRCGRGAARGDRSRGQTKARRGPPRARPSGCGHASPRLELPGSAFDRWRATAPNPAGCATETPPRHAARASSSRRAGPSRNPYRKSRRAGSRNLLVGGPRAAGCSRKGVRMVRPAQPEENTATAAVTPAPRHCFALVPAFGRHAAAGRLRRGPYYPPAGDGRPSSGPIVRHISLRTTVTRPPRCTTGPARTASSSPIPLRRGDLRGRVRAAVDAAALGDDTGQPGGARPVLVANLRRGGLPASPDSPCSVLRARRFRPGAAHRAGPGDARPGPGPTCWPSPRSWDHHWTWVAPADALLGWSRPARGAVQGQLAGGHGRPDTGNRFLASILGSCRRPGCSGTRPPPILRRATSGGIANTTGMACNCSVAAFGCGPQDSLNATSCSAGSSVAGYNQPQGVAHHPGTEPGSGAAKRAGCPSPGRLGPGRLGPDRLSLGRLSLGRLVLESSCLAATAEGIAGYANTGQDHHSGQHPYLCLNDSLCSFDGHEYTRSSR
jgi:hypothetical protein